jgi:hypothetical protein
LPLILGNYDSTNVGEDEVLVHYLEWQVAAITQDETYTTWPATNSSVAVINNQTSIARNTYPDFWYEIEGNNITVEGDLVIENCDDGETGGYDGYPPENMTYEYGYGKLTGGHIDASLGDKPFGTLGQGTES